MVADVPSHIVGELTVTVGFAFTVTVVEQVEILPHASVTVHAIVDTPALNVPLASLPDPLLLVNPVIWYVIAGETLQLSETTNTGIV